MTENLFDPLDQFRSVASAQQLQRVGVMQGVRGAYFRHPRHDEVTDHIDDLLALLLEHRDPRLPAGQHEGRGIAVIGEPRAGKTTMLRRIFQEHPAFPGYGQEGSRCPLVSVIPQGACTLSRFTIDTLRKLGMPVSDVPRQEQRIAHMVRDHMRLMGVKVLHVDEAHHITQPANAIQIKKIINVFKCLMIDDEWPIGLVFSGIPEIIGAIRQDRQLQARFKFIFMAGLTVAADARKIGGIVRQLAGLAKLEIAAEHVDALAPRLIHAGGYQLGRTIEYVQDAIEVRLKRNSRLAAEGHASDQPLCPEDFAQAYARSTGVQADDNPFVADDWEATDPFQTLDSMADRDGPPAPAKRSVRRKGG
jgi:hypothetical protein